MPIPRALAQIPARRLYAQYLTGRSLPGPVQVVEHLVAVQAQDFAGAKWGLGKRCPGSTDESVERAFDEGRILRTHLLRPTWHFVTSADIRWLLKLTAPRVHVVNGSMYRKLEIDPRTRTRAAHALEKALGGGVFKTRNDLRGVFKQARIDASDNQRLTYLVMAAELDGIICSGPRIGKQFSYALLEDRAPASRNPGNDEAAVELALRFFGSRGPATIDDFSRWSGLTKAVVRQAVADSGQELESETIDGKEYLFAEPSAGPVSSSAHLISIYDEYISGYKDRGAIVPREYGLNLIALGNALTGVLVYDGRIVGTWKRTIFKETVSVTLDLYEQLSRKKHGVVRNEIERYAAFLQLDSAQE